MPLRQKTVAVHIYRL